jgi:hypothetical protein
MNASEARVRFMKASSDHRLQRVACSRCRREGIAMRRGSLSVHSYARRLDHAFARTCDVARQLAVALLPNRHPINPDGSRARVFLTVCKSNDRLDERESLYFPSRPCASAMAAPLKQRRNGESRLAPGFTLLMGISATPLVAQRWSVELVLVVVLQAPIQREREVGLPLRLGISGGTIRM